MRLIVFLFCLLLVLICLLSCTNSETYVRVSPGTLVRHYRDSPDVAAEDWNSRRIICSLAKGEYVCKDNSIHWWIGDSKHPSALVFYGSESLPKDNTETIEIRGLCTGPKHDGLFRTITINFRIEIKDCVFTVIR